jgi:hypothetical protein
METSHRLRALLDGLAAGMKEGGAAREGSKYGIEEFFDVKYLCTGGIDPQISRGAGGRGSGYLGTLNSDSVRKRNWST